MNAIPEKISRQRENIYPGARVQPENEIRQHTAERFTFTALVSGHPMDGQVYVFRGATHDHVVVLLMQQDLSARGTRTVDQIVQSFEIDDGQGA